MAATLGASCSRCSFMSALLPCPSPTALFFFFCNRARCVIHLSANLVSNTSPHMRAQTSVLGFYCVCFCLKKIIDFNSSNCSICSSLVACVQYWVFLLKDVSCACFHEDAVEQSNAASFPGLSVSELRRRDPLRRRSGAVRAVSGRDVPGRGGTDVLRGLSRTGRKRSLQGRRGSEHVRVWG